MAAAAVYAGAAACSGRDATGASPAVPDTAAYQLATVNGFRVPVEVRNDASGRVEVSAGVLQLAGGAYSQALQITDTPPSGLATTRTTTSQGTVTYDGAVIHFHSSDGTAWDGTMSPQRIDYSIPGNTGALAFSFRQ